ncbi:MXAN_6640 family putative metalloprotease [Nocardioides sp.]|uniref:MXAN_6640 family putative metalloprotease n=1 Tax=Nocardioides sp. TaxID=35761 RepID=UPI00286A0002|nr:MXAN_6640 family putative metalloprotease [Nocardioides sp.]
MSAQLPRRTPLLVVVAAVLAALLAAPVAQAEAPAAPAPASTSQARQALAAAQAVLRGDSAVVARGSAASSSSGGDATLALRDLALLQDQLTGADRQAAERLLARPTDGSQDPQGDGYSVPQAPPVCGADVCVHYVATTNDAPSMKDTSPADGVPDYVATALATLTSVHNTYVGAGYREPKGDGNRGGGSNLMDIYLADIGDAGLYGYCTTDDKTAFKAPWARSAYCVLDDDYARSEFGTNTPIENLQVTAAHEYFHAVQYAYDFKEDSWLLEATATWAEDELFDGVDDNVQYLRYSPLTRPRVPLDSSGGGFFYGTFVFFRYLTERFPASQGGLPTLVRDIWRKADGTTGAPDQYSWQAVATVLRGRRTTAATAFTAFAEANRRPAQTYDEGAANRYPKARLADSFTLGVRGIRQELKLSHLTSATYRLSPGGALRNKAFKLRVGLDLAPTFRGSSAIVTVYTTSGDVRRNVIKLRKDGNATKVVPFSKATVHQVEVTLVNASGRYDCFVRGAFSCQGDSRDDRQVQRFTARAFR